MHTSYGVGPYTVAMIQVTPSCFVAVTFCARHAPVHYIMLIFNV